MYQRLKNRLRFLVYRAQAGIFSNRRIKTSFGDIRLTTGTENEVHRVATFFSKEPETVEWISNFDSKCPQSSLVFFDIGANVGIYSLFAARAAKNIRVFSFEPESQSFASLCKNIHANRFRSVVPYQLALSDGSGLVDLNVSSLAAGAGAAALNEKYRFLKVSDTEVFKQGVYRSTIDELVFTHGLPTPNFIKVDVDGLECPILYGAEKVLASPSLVSILVEFQYENEKDIDGVKEYLGKFGLQQVGKSAWIETAGSIRSQNFIFEKKK